MTIRDELLEKRLNELEQSGRMVDEYVSTLPESEADLRPLLAAADALRHAPAVEPSESFSSTARTRMLNMIEAHQPAGEATVRVWPKRSWWGGWMPASIFAKVAVAVVAVVLIAGGTAAAAPSAMPDSPLYPVKLAMENAQVSLASNDQERTRLYMDIADRRVSEIAKMAGSNDANGLTTAANNYQDALDSAVKSTLQPGMPDALERDLDSHMSAQRQRLQQVLDSGSTSTMGGNALRQSLGCVESHQNVLRQHSGNDRSNYNTPGTPSGPQATGTAAAPSMPNSGMQATPWSGENQQTPDMQPHVWDHSMSGSGWMGGSQATASPAGEHQSMPSGEAGSGDTMEHQGTTEQHDQGGQMPAMTPYAQPVATPYSQWDNSGMQTPTSSQPAPTGTAHDGQSGGQMGGHSGGGSWGGH